MLFRSQSQGTVALSDLALANVEALANRGEDGTNTGQCFLQQSSGSSGDSGYKIYCNSETSNTQIYPCPSSESHGTYLNTATDRCTK